MLESLSEMCTLYYQCQHARKVYIQPNFIVQDVLYISSLFLCSTLYSIQSRDVVDLKSREHEIKYMKGLRRKFKEIDKLSYFRIKMATSRVFSFSLLKSTAPTFTMNWNCSGSLLGAYLQWSVNRTHRTVEASP